MNLKIAKTKTRKVGNSVGITLPKVTGFGVNVPVTIEKSDNDTLIIRRQATTNNPWDNGSFNQVNFRQELDKIGFNIGNETGKGREL